MKLRYQNENDFEKKEEKREAEEGKSRLRELCSKLWDATKKGAGILCFAAGTAIAVNGCGGGVTSKDDVIEEPVQKDGQEDDIDNENDSREDIENEDVELENIDGDAEENEPTQNCLGPGTPLEGEVDPLIAGTNNGDIILSGDSSVVSGDAELTVGAVIDKTNLLILGQCPNEPDVIAGLGAQGSTVEVVSQYKLDMGKGTYNANLPVVSGELCPPLENDNVPVSKFGTQVNQAIKNATVGSVRTRAGFSFVPESLQTKLLVNDVESASPIVLDGSDYAVKWLSIAVEQQALNMDALIYSNSGEVLRALRVHGNGITGTSKILRIFQLGNDNKIIPSVNWIIPAGDGPNGEVKMCLRSEDGSPKELPLDINGTVASLVEDACGKIFASFDIINLSSGIHWIQPPPLPSSYSISNPVGTGLAAMEDGILTITLTIRKNNISLDYGAEFIGTITVYGTLVSRERNPKRKAFDAIDFNVSVGIYDPNAQEYPEKCGYTPKLDENI